MGGEIFFYYYEEVYVRRKPRERREHISHVTEESEDFISKAEGIARPRILEEHRVGETIYYVELIGVDDKSNIKLELEGNTLRIEAKLSKPLIYPGLTEETYFKEYRAEIELPYTPEAKDLHATFDRDRCLLIIRLRKKRKTMPINVE